MTGYMAESKACLDFHDPHVKAFMTVADPFWRSDQSIVLDQNGSGDWQFDINDFDYLKSGGHGKTWPAISKEQLFAAMYHKANHKAAWM